MEAIAPEAIDVELITIPANRRAINQDAVDRLKTSIEAIGLHTPLTVLSVNDGERLDLVTGAHRLHAVKALGWPFVPCFVIEDDLVEAQMWEIAENLHRAELTALERDEQIAKWVELAEAKLSQVATVSDKGGRGREGGTRAASRELGISKDNAHRATKVASLSAEAKEYARESGMEKNRSALLEAAREETPEGQLTALQRRVRAKLADEPLNDIEAKETQLRALMAAWNKAGKEAREEFLDRIDSPVMDRRYG